MAGSYYSGVNVSATAQSERRMSWRESQQLPLVTGWTRVLRIRELARHATARHSTTAGTQAHLNDFQVRAYLLGLLPRHVAAAANHCGE